MDASYEGEPELPAGTSGDDQIWVDVIQKMESVYAELVEQQSELEQKNSELEEAEQFIGSVLTAMTDVLLVCDTRCRIEKTNSALSNLTGCATEHFIGKPLNEVFTSECADRVERFGEVLQQELVTDLEVELRCADGATTPLALNCSARYDHNGRIVGMVLIGRPVGELKRAYDRLKQTQQQLVHSEKMASLGRLVAGVAHELNNPISFVFGNMHALERYGKRISQYLHEINRLAAGPELDALKHELRIDRILDDIDPLIAGTLEGAERVSDIVQDLLRYSGDQRETPEIVDLTAAIHKAVDWVLRASRIQPSVHFVLPDTFELNMRKGQVHQILVNLIQNAVDAVELCEQPDIVIELTLQPDSTPPCVAIAIRDNGSGIKDDFLAQIFDPFFTTKPVGQGTGLGLYISYGLAQDAGGSLAVANNPDCGACFTLTLPLNHAVTTDTLHTGRLSDD
jgi:two-component system sensor histidine kinase HupT/HoxJ